MAQKQNQNNIALLWLFMALYLLNISVDSPDVSFQQPEDLSCNDQESVIEIVIEKFLGYDNLIAEQDDADSGEQSLAKKSCCLDYFVLPKFPLPTKAICIHLKKSLLFGKSKNPKQPFGEEVVQPPEV